MWPTRCSSFVDATPEENSDILKMMMKTWSMIKNWEDKNHISFCCYYPFFKNLVFLAVGNVWFWNQIWIIFRSTFNLVLKPQISKFWLIPDIWYHNILISDDLWLLVVPVVTRPGWNSDSIFLSSASRSGICSTIKRRPETQLSSVSPIYLYLNLHFYIYLLFGLELLNFTSELINCV